MTATTTEYEESSSTCLTALESRARRPPPSGTGGQPEAPGEPLRALS
jgi:RNA polymerase sigma-70 factor (ECF subfamily)